MGLALELACVALQLRNRCDPATIAVVAEKIIAMANAGERSATTLCDRALSELGCPIVSGPPAATPGGAHLLDDVSAPSWLLRGAFLWPQSKPLFLRLTTTRACPWSKRHK